MTIWVLEPRDPLIARDGKPFGVGVRAATLPFPFPSTTTGTARTRAGLENGFFDPARQVNGESLPDAVKKLGVSGPLLVELNDNEDIETWLMPAPMDAVLYRNQQNEDVIQRLMPLSVGAELTNLNQAPHASDNLALVGPAKRISGKPYDDKESPRFWYWEQFRQWLCDPDRLAANFTCNTQLGHRGAPPQMRTHVAIDPDKFTARDAQLFQTRGLEFTHGEPDQLSKARRLALAIATKDEEAPIKLPEESGLAPLGGESRLAAWRKSQQTTFPNNCLTILQERIAEHRACRLILLTPAYFANGSSPAWLRQPRHGVEVTLRAMAAGRERVVSGWDYEKGRPKPTRRLAPAGAVYFLSLKGTETDIKTWVEKTWMQCVSDDENGKDTFRRDGFGLAAFGVWAKDSEPQEMKMEGRDEKTS